LQDKKCRELSAHVLYFLNKCYVTEFNCRRSSLVFRN